MSPDEIDWNYSSTEDLIEAFSLLDELGKNDDAAEVLEVILSRTEEAPARSHDVPT